MSTDLDPRVHELFTERLSRIPAPLPRAPRQRSRPRRALAGALLALLMTASLGLALEVNASAESQGASCADAMTKIKLLVDKIVGDNFATKSEAEQIATKVALGDQTDAILLKYSCPKGAKDANGAPEKKLTPNMEFKPAPVKVPEDSPQKGVTKP